MIDLLQTFIDAQHSWFVECLVLFLAPFVHEDVAILGGSLLVVEHKLPEYLALLSLYGGMVTSDFALYGLGALARGNPRVRRLLTSRRVDRLGQWLGTHTPEIVMLARLVPGSMFPVYVACGLTKVSFTRFALTTMLAGAIYLPVVFFLFTSFGDAILSDLGYWSWLIAIAVLLIAIAVWTNGPNWQLFFRVSASGARALLGRARSLGIAKAVTHPGMPSLAGLVRTVARAEKIPTLVFYFPLALQWLWLGLRHGDLSGPALANPRIESGGLWGESKTSCLDMVSGEQRAWLAEYTTILRGHGAASAHDDWQRALKAMEQAGLDFPVVAKPDIGWRGFGVRLVEDAAELETYFAAFPEDESVILQRPIPFEGEAGVLCVRLPGEPDGRILSMTFRYFPHVVGDGQTTLRDLVLADKRTAWKAGAHFGLDAMHLGRDLGDLERIPDEGETVRLSFIGSNRVGGLYRDARAYITPALTRRFDAISRSLPEFYYGRYDVRFESVEQLEQGEGFSIIEINGAGGESINVWDPAMPLKQVYRELFAQQRLLFEIGARNRALGHRRVGLLALLRSQWHQHRLIRHYPPSG